jgi:signal transduction histidine kinase
MGAGLGSIGILSGLAAEDETPDADRRSLAARVASLSETLGASLADIVWSLRPDTPELESLADYVVERASPLFAGRGPRFVARFPDPWPAVPLSLAVRRNLQLIALEALHNSVRHAEASRVELGFASESRRWLMWIEDDGRGMSAPEDKRGRGLGQTSLRKRAEEIGSTLNVDSAPGRGTRIEIRFDPRAESLGSGRRRRLF